VSSAVRSDALRRPHVLGLDDRPFQKRQREPVPLVAVPSSTASREDAPTPNERARSASRIANGLRCLPRSSARRSSRFTTTFLWNGERSSPRAVKGSTVGIGDRIARTDPAIVARTCRADGLLVKPDRPLGAPRRGEGLLVAGTCSGSARYVVALHVAEGDAPIEDDE